MRLLRLGPAPDLPGRLTLPALFCLLALEWAAFLAYFVRRFEWTRLPDSKPKSARDIIGQYTVYCAPLVLYGCIGGVCDFADRWFLQHFGGSAQQGFFAISQQFASIALLATTSILNIFWKEIAAAHHAGDRDRVRQLYFRSSRTLFFIASAGACFLIPHSRTLLARLAGPAFAWPALALMFLFPVFQTIGQLNGSFFYATEDTKTHVAIVSASLLLGLPVSYLVLAPATATIPGLGLGANGLAARAVVWAILTTSVHSWFVARRLGSKSDNFHHFAVLAGLAAFGWACKAAASAACGLVGHPSGVLPLAAAAPLFAAGAALFTLRWPEHVGTEPAQLRRVVDALKNRRWA